MSQVTLSVSEELLVALKATEYDFAARICFAAAVKLFELGQLSSGAAAQLAGVPKPYFLSRLSDYGVNTFDLSEEELSHDLENARSRFLHLADLPDVRAIPMAGDSAAKCDNPGTCGEPPRPWRETSCTPPSPHSASLARPNRTRPKPRAQDPSRSQHTQVV